MVDLAPEAGRPARSLSGGQLRRLGLAEVLVADPPVLLLDEPTVGLDPAQRRRFRSVLEQLDDGRQVIVSTHLVDDLDTSFDEVVVLSDGVIRFSGSVESFLAGSTFGEGTRRGEAAYAAVLEEPRADRA
jgi:ABC-2 type transport system ATP-binding protein